MADIYITPKDIRKYIFMIVLFNAVFPKVLEESNVMINISDNGNVTKMCYDSFINTFDSYGLNHVAD